MAKKLQQEEIIKAMNVFWDKGYFNTGVEDITKNTGLNRAKIYGNFGDKHGLFVECLDLYIKEVLFELLSPIMQPETSIENLEVFYKNIMKHEEFAKRGCLLMATMADAPSHSEEILSKISFFIDTMKENIIRQLEGKKVAPYKSVDVIASMGVGHFFGILSLLRLGDRKGIAKEQVEGILSIISFIKENNSH